MLTMPANNVIISNISNETAQAQGDGGGLNAVAPRRPAFTEEQIAQFNLRGARPRTRHRSFCPLSAEQQPPAEPQPSTSAQAPEQTSTERFGPSFLQGFFVNCSVCRQKNKASAKCYECNSYLCEKCVFSHAKARATSFHHIYHFDSLAERLSPIVTGGLTQPTGTSETTPTNQNPPNNENQSTTNEESVASTSTITAQNATNHASSRVVGAERRSSGESSRNSSRTSSLTLPSPSTSSSRRESYEGLASIQTTINSLAQALSQQNNSFYSSMSSHSYGSSISSPPDSRSAQSASPARSTPADVATTNNQIAIISPNQDAQGNSSGEANNSMALALNHLELFPCLRHQSEFTFFCSDCMIPICTICLHERHMDHSLIYITDGLQRVSQMSHELNGQIRQMNAGLRQTLDGLQRMCEGIEYRAHQVAIDVKCTIRRFITALEARQDDLLQRLEQARQVKLKLVNFQMENIRLHYSKLARASELVNNPSRFTSPIENMAANHQAFRELRQAKNLGTNIFPCEDDGFMFMAPSDSQLHSIAFMGHLHISSSPIINSVMLCRQPLLYLSTPVPFPECPIPAAKSRPIYGCKDIIAVKDFGRMPKHIWGKAGPDDGELCRPWGITMNRFRQIIIADRSNNRIQIFDHEGNYVFQFGSHGSREGQFDRPAAVACNPNDDMVVADKDNHRVQVFNRNGEFLFTFGEKGSQIGQFMYPWDVACDSMGNILVSDARNHRIQLFRWNGIFITKWGGEMSMPRLFDTPRGVAFDPMGNILMTDFNLHRVVMIERMTGKVRYIGREGKERGQFNRPQGICCDDRGWFVVTDSRNYRFQVFNDKGEFMWMVGRQGKEDPGEFDRPCDAFIDPEGHIHLMDFGNDRIQVF